MVYINNIKETFLDFPDDESLAVIVFFEGCEHNCPGCQNPELQKRDKEKGVDLITAYQTIFERLTKNRTDKLVLSGGDPFCSKNKADLKDMFALISSLEDAGIQICVYTGYTFEQVEKLYKDYGVEEETFNLGLGVSSKIERTFFYPTYLKCGVYNEHLLNPDMGKTDDAFILASSNQAFYKKIANEDFKYKCLTVDGVLRFR